MNHEYNGISLSRAVCWKKPAPESFCPKAAGLLKYVGHSDVFTNTAKYLVRDYSIRLLLQDLRLEEQ